MVKACSRPRTVLALAVKTVVVRKSLDLTVVPVRFRPRAPIWRAVLVQSGAAFSFFCLAAVQHKPHDVQSWGCLECRPVRRRAQSADDLESSPPFLCLDGVLLFIVGNHRIQNFVTSPSLNSVVQDGLLNAV